MDHKIRRQIAPTQTNIMKHVRFVIRVFVENGEKDSIKLNVDTT